MKCSAALNSRRSQYVPVQKHGPPLHSGECSDATGIRSEIIDCCQQQKRGLSCRSVFCESRFVEFDSVTRLFFDQLATPLFSLEQTCKPFDACAFCMIGISARLKIVLVGR